MPKTYFTSDFHIGHINILKYEPSRVTAIIDYAATAYGENAAEMAKKNVENGNLDLLIPMQTEMLVENWNSVVKDDDVVWFLGDLTLGRAIDVCEIVPHLKGHKRIILGNHDRIKIGDYYAMGFEFVSPYPIVLKQRFLLSHAPINENGMFNIFGHVHSNPAWETHTDNGFCVCVERHDFMPVRCEEFDKA